jgi:lysyl-tRNA synthetase class 2
MKRLDVRERVTLDARAFFRGRGFLEVQTPVMVPSPGMDLHLDAYAVDKAFLGTSPEYQMKRLLADGHERIFQIGPCFRRGEKGELHNPEFTMLEWYRRDADVESVMRDTEQLVARISGGRFDVDGWFVEALPPFPRMTVAQAFERFAGVSEAELVEMAASDEDTYFRAWVEHVDPALRSLHHAIFVVDFPAPMASLARRKPSDPRWAERFELVIAGVELCNGFGELVDPVEQRARFEHDRAERAKRKMPVYPVDEKLLEALGKLPPSAGNALGLDRLAALAAGTRNIESVVAFTVTDL